MVISLLTITFSDNIFPQFIVFLFKKIFVYLFIYLWLRRVFVAACRLSLVVVRRLLIEVASLVAQHRL